MLKQNQSEERKGEICTIVIGGYSSKRSKLKHYSSLDIIYKN